MSETTRFLHAIAHATAALGLYGPGHPARESALDEAWARLEDLRRDVPEPAFSFLENTVVAGDTPLHELRAWPWGRRFSRVGVQRLEIDAAAGRGDLDRFVADVAARLGADHRPATSPAGPLRWGPLGLRNEMEGVVAGYGSSFRIDEEVALVQWIYDRAETAGDVPAEEVETVVASLAIAVQCEGAALEPLLERGRSDRYGATHAINVATLAMALAERLGIGSRDIRAIGTAALLCDIGMTRLPRELLETPVLSGEQRRAVQRHTSEGARLLLAKPGDFDLAAVVAYEHHLQPDGRGYPYVAAEHEAHYVSRIVRICDVYDALRSLRAARPAWSAEEAIGHLERGAGTAFDAGLAAAFVRMMSEAERAAA